MEKNISKNSLVTLSLSVELEDKTAIDKSDNLMYLHGSYDQIFKRVESELNGKVEGYKFDLILAPEEAFGLYDESFVIREPLNQLPEDITLGMELDDGEDDGLIWIVEDISEGFATLNANHEMAGVPLRVYGEVLNVEQLTEDGAKEVLEMSHEH